MIELITSLLNLTASIIALVTAVTAVIAYKLSKK